MADQDEVWFDEAAGPLVRPYAVTRGRTSTNRYRLEMITLVVASHPETHAPVLEPEYARILRACAVPQSVAEIAAQVALPLGAVKVLLSDLIERGYVTFRVNPASMAAPDMDLMQKVLDGIRKL